MSTILVALAQPTILQVNVEYELMREFVAERKEVRGVVPPPVHVVAHHFVGVRAIHAIDCRCEALPPVNGLLLVLHSE